MYFVFVLIFIASVSNVFSDDHKLVVLSFDGIHHSFIKPNFTPNLVQLIRDTSGAGPIDMHSSFPSKTKVSHVTVSTGLYPCNHGVYNDEMFDSNGGIWLNDKAQYQTKENVVPIWIENQQKGGERNSGMMMWPGGEFDYSGTKAQYIEPYNASLAWNQRVDKIVDWMTKAEKKANLVMAYFEDTPCYDKRKIQSHMKSHMEKIDQTIKKLYDDLKSKQSGDFDMIIMSGHGTEMVEYENVLKINDYLGEFPASDYKIIVSGPIVFIKPKTELYSSFMKKFDTNSESTKKFLASNVNDLTERFNLGSSSLNNVIIVRASPGYTFIEDAKLDQRVTTVGDANYFVTYESGYDNWNTAMDGFFVGIGKNFKKTRFTTVHLEILDIYPILKVLLDMKTDASEVQKIKVYVESVRELLIDDIVPPRPEDTSENETTEEKTTNGTQEL